MRWTSRRVVVTGAGGFIGSHLTERLAREGAEVQAIVRYNSRGDEGNLRLVEPALRATLNIHRIELTEIDAVREACRGAEIIFNLAAYVGIPYSYANPQDVVVNNVLSTLNVLLVAKELGVSRLVQTSTSEVYGSARQVPIPETHVLQPQSPYSASKIATDSVALSFHYSYALPVTVVRPFNTYGPRQSARAVIPSVICQALEGDQIMVGATSTTRDFNFVDDTVHGFMLAADSPRTIGEVINIGSGRETRVSDVLQSIVRIVGNSSRVVHDEKRVRPVQSEVSRLCADISKAHGLIGYAPQVPLEEGLRRTVDWMSDHRELYHPETYNV